MSIYKLSNYLFVCEPVTGLGGCGAELLIEQVRDKHAAARQAVELGWLASLPSPWDDERKWSTLCPSCTAERDTIIGHARKKRTGIK